MKKCSLLIIIFMFIFQIITYAQIKDIKYHWAFEDINRCIQNEYINGYEDNSFRPDNNIKYNEFIKIIVKVMDNSIYNDIEKWDETYINYAKQNSLINNDLDYNYETLIKRKDVFKILYKYIQNNLGDMIIENIKEKECQLKDIDNNDNEILFLYNNHIITGYPDNTLKLNDNITRAEVTVLLNRTTDYISKRIYNENIKEDIFFNKNISHFTNYFTNNENVYETEYFITKDKVIFYKNNKKYAQIQNDELNRILLILLNKKNYVLNTYDKQNQCINIKYGDTLGYILNQDQIIEIDIFNKEKIKEEYSFKTKISIYRLWKELYEVRNNLQSKYYVEKLKKVLEIYLNNEEIEEILNFIMNKENYKEYIKQSNYLLEKKDNLLYIYL
ncbi:MAG: S-layer homology domain-containing protein [Clostridiales bacterium]|nr:S-layer homology domain-containing protein [Clostridiales bacterium]